jgi:hypothetical protein
MPTVSLKNVLGLIELIAFAIVGSFLIPLFEGAFWYLGTRFSLPEIILSTIGLLALFLALLSILFAGISKIPLFILVRQQMDSLWKGQPNMAKVSYYVAVFSFALLCGLFGLLFPIYIPMGYAFVAFFLMGLFLVCRSVWFREG